MKWLAHVAHVLWEHTRNERCLNGMTFTLLSMPVQCIDYRKKLDPSVARDEQWLEMLLAVSGWPASVVDFVGRCRAPVEEVRLVGYFLFLFCFVFSAQSGFAGVIIRQLYCL